MRERVSAGTPALRPRADVGSACGTRSSSLRSRYRLWSSRRPRCSSARCARPRASTPALPPSHVALMRVELGLQGYDEVRGRRFYDELLRSVAATPGVESASLAQIVPLGLSGQRRGLEVVGYAAQARRGDGVRRQRGERRTFPDHGGARSCAVERSTRATARVPRPSRSSTRRSRGGSGPTRIRSAVASS